MEKSKFKLTYDEKTIEKIIGNPEIMINHFMFQKGEGLPVHNANSNVYMIITKGTLSLRLDDSDLKHQAGHILSIPFGTEMHVRNEDDDILEMFVLKVPHPEYYGK